jgi:hypothetical protein
MLFTNLVCLTVVLAEEFENESSLDLRRRIAAGQGKLLTISTCGQPSTSLAINQEKDAALQRRLLKIEKAP